MKVTPGGSSFTVNTTLPGDQDSADIVALADGRFAAVWSDGYNTIRARIIDPANADAGSEFTVNDPAGFVLQDSPAVTALANGGFVVVWRDDRAGILAQRFDASGKAEGTRVQITDGDKSGTTMPAVAALSGGGFAVAWGGSPVSNGRTDVFAQVVDASGNKGTEVKLTAANGPFGARDVTITKGDRNSFIVAWSEDSDGVKSVKAQHLTDKGTPYDNKGVMTIDSGPKFIGSPSLAGMGGDSQSPFVIAWVALDVDRNWTIKTQVFDAQHKPVRSAVEVVGPAADVTSQPDVTMLSDGAYAVSWQSTSSTTREVDVFARLFTKDGRPNGEAFMLNADAAAGAQIAPQIAAGKDGRLYALWTDGLGDQSDVKGRSFLVVNEGPAVNPDADLRVPDFAAIEDKAFRVVIPEQAFVDPEGDPLRYSLTMADGKPLPAWLRFTDSDMGLEGKPPANYNGTLDLKLTATDGRTTASDLFKVNIAAQNDVPVLNKPLPDVTVTEGKQWKIMLPRDSFLDADGQTLKYSVEKAYSSFGGFNFVHPQFVITAVSLGLFFAVEDEDFDGKVTVTLKASDGKASAKDTFFINVKNVADAPTLASGPDKNKDGMGDNAGAKAAYSIAEGSTDPITRFTVDDPDPNTKLFYKLSGIDSFRFKIDAKGDLSFKTGPDYETPADGGKDKASLRNNVYDVNVTVSDGKLTDTQAVAVAIKDVKPYTKPGTARGESITGTSERDTLDGREGNDTLTGQGGRDVFVFSTKLDARHNVDTITDFSYGAGIIYNSSDFILLDTDIFKGLRKTGGKGDDKDWLHRDDFKTIESAGSTKGVDETDRILYDKKGHGLYYDPDGSKAGAPILFAKIFSNHEMSSSDFLVA